MARTRFRRQDEKQSKSRLQVVQQEARDRAVFWDRTSISSFLVAAAFGGVIALLIGFYGLMNGELSIGHYFKLSLASSEWRFTVICVAIVLFGINLIAPLPLFWTISERKAVIICAAFMGFNFLLFMYAFLIDVVARSDFFSY